VEVHRRSGQAKAFTIADDRLNENSVWDERLLGEQLMKLSKLELDFSIEVTGFDTGEIDLRIEGLSVDGHEQEDPADALDAIRKIDFDDYTELLPPFAIISLTSFTYNIGASITAGFVLYPWFKVAAGRGREIRPGLWVRNILSTLFFCVLSVLTNFNGRLQGQIKTAGRDAPGGLRSHGQTISANPRRPSSCCDRRRFSPVPDRLC
jgi:hypothetical protein